MDRMVLIFLPTLIINCDGFRVLGPSDPLSIQLGGSVMLPCYVETPLPMDELEVEWKRTDTLVHLWQNGQSEPESQNQDYRERAHFFSEEVKHGNFSLLLTNVTSKDAGVYRCVIYTGKESNEASIEIKEADHLIVTGGHAVSAYADEDVTLNCSIKSHLPLEQIEQIEWRKVDENILVLLYEYGEVLTDSSDERYRDRVELFSNEEVQKGNFSLRLKNVRTEDKGMFMCVAFHEDLSANATVEVQQLGLSYLHYGIFFLCFVALGSLLLSFPAFISVKNNNYSRRSLAIQYTLVVLPNTALFFAFILWGVTDGTHWTSYFRCH
ncbi:butyrophilin-like protein 2 [Trichomycterus rosablanca]|uniref:butyrophilin-like protein 2 n=1 Tax=Trichomycterus rosablanca TaxID=2290929 RepID=UPI002F35BDBD